MKVSGILRQVGGRSIEFGTLDDVSLLFGDVCLGSFPASSLKRVQGHLEFVNEDRSAGLHTFIIDDAKGKCSTSTRSGWIPGRCLGLIFWSRLFRTSCPSR